MELAPNLSLPEATHRLVTRCVAGDETAWRSLHGRYLPVALRFLQRLGVPGSELEDASQAVFLDVFRHLAGFRGDAELSTWLYRICVTHARKARQRARIAQVFGWLTAVSAADEPRVLPDDDDCARRLERALMGLGEQDRTVLVLFELEGVSGQRIAEILGTPEATVWRRLHYARQRFRAAFAGEPEGAS